MPINFDDLTSTGTPQQPKGSVVGSAFSDLEPTPEQRRADKLKKIARAAVGSENPGASDVFGDAFTLGLQKPTAGLATGLGNWITGKSGFGEGYSAGTGAYQDYLDEAKKNSGWGGTAADIAGSTLTAAPARGAQVATGIWPMVKQAAGMGAVEGAARGSDDWGSAIGGAVEDAALGGLSTAAIGSLIQRVLPQLRRERLQQREDARGPHPEVIKDQARAIYRQLDQAGVAFDNSQSDALASAVRGDLMQNGWDPQGVHSTLNGVIQRIEGLRGQPVSLETLQQIREQVGSNATAMEPQVRRIAGRILRQIDGFVTNETPAMSSIPGDQVGPLWAEARRLWRTASTAEDIGWRVDKAGRRAASTNSGQNVENAIRQNIRGAVDKATQPGRYNPYNPAELAQMERVVEGTPAQNALRWTGNQVAGIGGQAAGVLGGAGALAGGIGLPHDPTTAALLAGAGMAGSAGMTGLGHLIKGQASNMAEDEADRLIRLISTGSMLQPPPAGPPTRAALANFLVSRGAGVAAGGQ